MYKCLKFKLWLSNSVRAMYLDLIRSDRLMCAFEKDNIIEPFFNNFYFLLSASETCKRRHKQSMLTNPSSCGPRVVALYPLKWIYTYEKAHISIEKEPKHTWS